MYVICLTVGRDLMERWCGGRYVLELCGECVWICAAEGVAGVTWPLCTVDGVVT